MIMTKRPGKESGVHLLNVGLTGSLQVYQQMRSRHIMLLYSIYLKFIYHAPFHHLLYTLPPSPLSRSSAQTNRQTDWYYVCMGLYRLKMSHRLAVVQTFLSMPNKLGVVTASFGGGGVWHTPTHSDRGRNRKVTDIPRPKPGTEAGPSALLSSSILNQLRDQLQHDRPF